MKYVSILMVMTILALGAYISSPTSVAVANLTVTGTPSPMVTSTPTIFCKPTPTPPPIVEAIEPAGRIGGYSWAVLTQTADDFNTRPYVYLGLGQELVILDVSHPAQPVRLGALALPSLIRDIEVVGNYAYIVSQWSGLVVVDVSEPSIPVEVGVFNDPLGPSHAVAVVGDYAYLANEWSGLRVIDISNPSHPREVSSYERDFFDYDSNTLETAWDVAVFGQYAYVTGNNGYNGFKGLYVLDISTPITPTLVSVYETPRDAYRVVVGDDGSYVYLLIPKSGDQSSKAKQDGTLHVVDVSHPETPTAVGSYGVPAYAWDLAVSDNYAHIVTGLGNKQGTTGGLHLINVFTPTTPIGVAVFSLPEPILAVAVSGTYAYIAGAEGMHVVDISDRAAPAEVGRYTAMGLVNEAVVVGDYTYIAAGSEGLQVMDVSNPAKPVQVGLYNTPGYALGVAVAGGYAYVADELSGMRVVDVSHPTTPVEVGFYDPPGEVRQVIIDGHYAYVLGDGDLRIVDISRPAAPVEIGHYDVSGWTERIAVAGE